MIEPRWNFQKCKYEIKVDDGKLSICELNAPFYDAKLEYETDDRHYKECVLFTKGKIQSKQMHTRSYSEGGENSNPPHIKNKVISVLDANGLPENLKGLLKLVVGK